MTIPKFQTVDSFEHAETMLVNLVSSAASGEGYLSLSYLLGTQAILADLMVPYKANLMHNKSILVHLMIN